MVATSTRLQPARPAPRTIALADLLAALSSEFANAAVSHHATLAFWRQSYEENPVLADYHPQGMVIVSAKVSIPVAVSQVTVKPPRVAQLTKTQLAEALASDLPKSKRQDITRLIHNDLAKNNRLSFANPKLVDEVAETVKRQFPDLASVFNRQYLADLQRDYLSQPAKDASVALLYRAKDLDQIKPELILHLDLEFKLE